MPANSRWDLIRRLRVNRKSAICQHACRSHRSTNNEGRSPQLRKLMRELISVKANGLIHVWMSWGDNVITATTVDEASIFVSLRLLVADRTIIP